jgi:hypothetical protein
MNQILVQDIPDNKLLFFFDLMQNLGFKTKEIKSGELSKDDIEFVEGTKEALEEVEKHLKGEIELKTLDQLIDEL